MSIKSTSPCFVCFFAEREGLATTQASLLRLTPFPCLAGRLLAKMSTAQGVDKSNYFVSTSLRPTNKFVCEQCKNKKMSIKSTSPCFVCFLRKGRDSNPRYSYPYTAFRVRPDRPLRHLSLCVLRCKCTNLFCNSNYFKQYFALFLCKTEI